MREGTEACDGSDVGNMTCADLGASEGMLACTSGCELDQTNCRNVLFQEDFTDITGWTLNVPVGTNGADNNFWVVDDYESGVAPPGCSVSGAGNHTLHVAPVFNPTGGATYDAGGLCGLLFCPQSSVRAESPAFSTVGMGGLTIAFDFTSYGDGLIDNASVWVSVRGTWELVAPSLKSPLCGNGTGQWAAFSADLPASASNVDSVKIGFLWENNDDGVGTDPSVAVDNLRVTGRGLR